MQPIYSHARIRILCALAAMALLAACGDSHTNFLTNEADLQTAISQLRSAIGARPRVLKIGVEVDVVAIEAQDPKNPNHVDRWRYVNFVFGPVSTQRLMGPDPVELNLLNPDLEANLFDLSVVDFSATSKLESAALKRAHLQDAAVISRMEIARQTFILPEPSSGDVRWSLHIESGRESADIHANASGAITRAELGGTMHAQTLNLINEPALVAAAAADFRAKVGAQPVVTKVSIDPKTVAFKTVIRDTTFGKAESGPPSYSSFTWDLNGLIQHLGVVDIRSATKLPPLPLFGVDEVNWTLVGKLEADALARVAIRGPASPRFTSKNHSRSRARQFSPGRWRLLIPTTRRPLSSPTRMASSGASSCRRAVVPSSIGAIPRRSPGSSQVLDRPLDPTPASL